MRHLVNKVPTSIFISSLACAFFLDIKAVNWALVYGEFIGSEAGVMDILFPATIGLIVVLAIFKYGGYSFSDNINGWLLVAFLVAYYWFSTRVIGPSHTTTSLFFGFTIAGIIIPMLSRIDARILLKAAMLFPTFAILRLNKVFVPDLATGSISMDASYGFAISITASIVYLVTYFRDESGFARILSILALLINAVFLFFLLLFGSRGPLFGFLCLIFFLYVVRYNENGGVRIRQSKKRKVLVVLIGTLLLLGPLLALLSDLFSAFGVNLYFIDKMIQLRESGDVSNGRGDLIRIAFSGFLDSPIWGNGFDRFNAHTNMLYPHNFLLQILYDGGLILFSILIIPAIKEIGNKYRKCDRDVYAMTTFIIFASVPGALFSQNLWMIGPLWYLVGFLKTKNHIYKHRLTR